MLQNPSGKWILTTRSLSQKANGLLFTCTGYSGSDLQALCEEAAMMPIRELGGNILTVKADQVTHIKSVVNLLTLILSVSLKIRVK